MLFELDKEYIEKCNKLTFHEERLKFLRRNKKSITLQDPRTGGCPVCQRPLEPSLDETYSYLQDINDTESEISKESESCKNIQSKINSLKNRINDLREDISTNYAIYRNHTNGDLSTGDWVDNKVNVQLIKDITYKIGTIEEKITSVDNELTKFRTDSAIIELRKSKEKIFYGYFSSFLKELSVGKETEAYERLYGIYLFPVQGVELHKTMLAYHFALNKLIFTSENTNRMPFIMDAIFKEDIDADNKDLLLKFIYKNLPNDTQTIISIAESQKEPGMIKRFYKDFFNSQAHLICIGNSEKERSFLSDYNDITPLGLISKTTESIYG